MLSPPSQQMYCFILLRTSIYEDPICSLVPISRKTIINTGDIWYFLACDTLWWCPSLLRLQHKLLWSGWLVRGRSLHPTVMKEVEAQYCQKGYLGTYILVGDINVQSIISGREICQHSWDFLGLGICLPAFTCNSNLPSPYEFLTTLAQCAAAKCVL